MNEREEQLWEYIRSLQSQIDHLVSTDHARLSRIRKLEEDRAILRQRLAEALARAGRFTARRMKHRNGDRAITADREPSTAPLPPSLEVPGVGTISEPPMPMTTPRSSLKVATVLDTISAAVLGPEFRAIPIGAISWREELEPSPPDLLLVESAYHGIDGSWATRIARFGEPSQMLRDLVSWCQGRGVPTIFWNKEDPINFEWFIESAGLFDFVFTVDSQQLERYKDRLGHDRIDVLPFFAQPEFHHPPTKEQRPGAVAFAGSYFASKHPERREQMELVLDPARDFGLHIFDRHGDTSDSRFAWPEKYRPHIVGSLTYLQTVEAYRRYRVFLNVNTVTGSPTMCARRIFELAACGTPVVSGPARAIEELEERGVLRIGRTPEQSRAALELLLHNEEARRQMAEAGRQWVAEGHTAADWVGHLVSTVESL